MILQCGHVVRKIFPTHDYARHVQETSFLNELKRWNLKTSYIIYHYHSLKIHFGLRDHTVMPNHFSMYLQIKGPFVANTVFFSSILKRVQVVIVIKRVNLQYNSKWHKKGINIVFL